MNAATVKIPVGQFSLLLEIDIDLSRELTANLPHSANEQGYVYIAADLFIVADDERLLVLPKRQLGPVLNFLFLIRDRLLNAEALQLPVEVLQPGMLGEWMYEYFCDEDIENKATCDDPLYDHISSLVLASDNQGVVSMYQANQKVAIEVWLRNRTSGPSHIWWDMCDREELLRHIGNAIENCHRSIE